MRATILPGNTCELAAGVGKGEGGCCLVLSMMLVFMMSVVVLMVRCAPADLPVDLKEQFCIFFTQHDRATRYWITSFCDWWRIDIGRRLRPGENMHPEVMCRKESWLCQFFVFELKDMFTWSSWWSMSQPENKQIFWD